MVDFSSKINTLVPTKVASQLQKRGNRVPHESKSFIARRTDWSPIFACCVVVVGNEETRLAVALSFRSLTASRASIALGFAIEFEVFQADSVEALIPLSFRFHKTWGTEKIPRATVGRHGLRLGGSPVGLTFRPKGPLSFTFPSATCSENTLSAGIR